MQRRAVERYLADELSGFDNRLLLRPGVGEYLRQLNGLLRPLIQRRWAAMVAQLKQLHESQLDAFLFGADRVQTARIRLGLWEIQDRRCFYCDTRVAELTGGHVDHFIPWSRYPDDGLDNLVIADAACNGCKSSSLAASHHVARWARRFADPSERGQVDMLAEQAGWERRAERSLAVARGIYCLLPDDARLWLRRKEFVLPDRVAIDAALVTSTTIGLGLCHVGGRAWMALSAGPGETRRSFVGADRMVPPTRSGRRSTRCSTRLISRTRSRSRRSSRTTPAARIR